jgi:hypothetical protein
MEIDLLLTEDIVMSVFTALLILILLVVLRFGVPFLLTMLFGYVMERFYYKRVATPTVD